MKTISYVSMTTDLDGNVIEPLMTKTLEIPEGVKYDEHGEAVLGGRVIYSPDHDVSEGKA